MIIHVSYIWFLLVSCLVFLESVNQAEQYNNKTLMLKHFSDLTNHVFANEEYYK